LFARLRQIRVLAGRTQEQARAALGWPLSKLVDIECGRSAPSTDDLRRFLKVHGTADAELEQMVRRAASLPRDAFCDVYPAHERRFVAAEGEAGRLRQYELNLVPELLRVLPAAGVHPGLAGSFAILDPADGRPGVAVGTAGQPGAVFLTGQGHRLLAAADQVARYGQLFSRLFDSAAPLSGTSVAQAAA
jgi:transcriptional regulator with XRE-family HTH domain